MNLNLQIILPISALTIGALLIMIVEAFLKKDEERTFSFILAVVTMLITLFVLFVHLFHPHSGMELDFFSTTTTSKIFGGSFVIDIFGMAVSIIICIGALLVILLSHNYIKRIKSNLGEFYTLILFATTGMLAMAIANDMMTFFISLEVMSVSVYILAGFQVDNIKSNESAMKYFVLGLFSTAFLILGIAFIYGATGEMGFVEISNKLGEYSASQNSENYYLAVTGLVLILVGFLFKVGAVPFQQWVPDVYEGSPTAVTAFMATGVKTAAFAIMIRILFASFGSEAYSDRWIDILKVVSILTMIVGNVIALVQTNLKRLLAYSGIAHTGYILLAVIAAKSSMQDGQEAVLFYLLTYTIMTVGAFVTLIAAGKENKDYETLEDIRGLGYKNKFLGLSMALFFFSMAGIPTTAGFMGKFFIFKTALEAELYLPTIIGIITAIISVYYYLRVIVYLYLKEEGREYEVHKTKWNYTFVAAITFALTIIFGIFPHIGFYLLKMSHVPLF